MSSKDAQTARHRRPPTSTSSPSAAPPSTPTPTPTPSTLALIPWDDLPHWRRDNAFIHSGYFPLKASYTHTLSALSRLHNETVNIWTHLLGAAISLACALYFRHAVHPRYASATTADLAVFGCFFAGAATCLGLSATFHTLCCHSEGVMRWGNKLDYTGIVVLIVASYMPPLYYGFFCRPGLVRAYQALICVLGTGCTVVSWVEKFRSPAWRPYRAIMFISLGLSGVIPVVHGIIIYGYAGLEERMGVSWVILQGAIYIFGAIFYAFRWPERSFPGAFDIWGSSHQIFHVCVLVAAATHLHGMTKAFDHRHTFIGSHCALDELM